MKKYKLGFDLCGLILFLAIMIPNIIWMVIPAPNDILRRESLTPVLDGIMSVFQIIFVGAMCGIVNKDNRKLHLSAWIIVAVISIAAYYITWGFYYSGNSSTPVVILLTISPCLSFIAYLIDRKNYIALFPATLFTLCHILHLILNFFK